jgi:hypothetical protein
MKPVELISLGAEERSWAYVKECLLSGCQKLRWRNQPTVREKGTDFRPYHDKLYVTVILIYLTFAVF